MRVLRCFLVALAMTVAFCPAQKAAARDDNSSTRINDRRVAVLNQLRNEINALHGFRSGVPRINLGPCGPFARDFRELWNARYKDKVNIAFVMINAPAGEFCGHVLVKLPGGNYYDGGNGVVTGPALLLQFPGSRLDEMTTFDPTVLEKKSGGFDRRYENCPNYSNDVTRQLIENHLALLAKD